MNHLEGMTHLENTYFAVRHGKSRPSRDGIILSREFRGCGLTKEGVGEVQESIDKAILDGVINFAEGGVIFSSPFPRTIQSADRLRRSLGVSERYTRTALKERDFGDFERQSTDNYRLVWANDMHSSEQTEHGVESVTQVLGRMTALVRDIEEGKLRSYQEGAKTVFLVSHGDPLQILQTAFEGIDPRYHHSEIPQLQTGEIRKLEWKNGSL